MHSATLIKDGEDGDIKMLAETLSDGFAEDPLMNWVMPKPELYQYFFELIIRSVYLPRGIVHLDRESRGAALWLPPGEEFEMIPRLGMLNLVLKLAVHRGPRPLWRIHQQGALFARNHPREPHYYLQFIGCRQSEQGRGLGAELLKHGTTLCDAEGVPAYLESSNPRNVSLYQRHGFQVVYQQALPGGGPSVAFMWRDPQ